MAVELTPEQIEYDTLSAMDRILDELGSEHLWDTKTCKEVMDLIKWAGPLMVSDGKKRQLRYEWHKLKERISEKD